MNSIDDEDGRNIDLGSRALDLSDISSALTDRMKMRKRRPLLISMN